MTAISQKVEMVFGARDSGAAKALDAIRSASDRAEKSASKLGTALIGFGAGFLTAGFAKKVISYAVDVAKAADKTSELGIAAQEFGAQVTGVTLSTEQLAWAQDRLQRAGVGAQCDMRLQDYRDISDPPFDAIASIEMFEAVGEPYWPSFFKTVHDRLKRGGVACIQSITIRDDLFADYRKGTDFIQQYVFPGGRLDAADCRVKLAKDLHPATLAKLMDRMRGRMTSVNMIFFMGGPQLGELDRR